MNEDGVFVHDLAPISFIRIAKGSSIISYPIQNPETLTLYEQYRKRTDEFPQIHLLGRLAKYKYSNMDAIVKKALELADTLIK